MTGIKRQAAIGHQLAGRIGSKRQLIARTLAQFIGGGKYLPGAAHIEQLAVGIGE